MHGGAGTYLTRVLRQGPPAWVRGLRGRFRSRLHDPGVAARLGFALAVAFGACFLTGLVSHFMQHPPAWLSWPSRPVWLYRVTQAVHVVTGVAAVPLLLAKLWTVYPALFSWPPFRSVATLVERAFVLLLVAAASFQVATGVANIAEWYPFRFNFTTTHYAVAWLLVGAVVVHAAHKWTIARAALRTPMRDPTDVSLSRRQFLGTVGAASGLLALVTVGQTVPALRPIGLLATHLDGVGPQGVPVRKTAVSAGVRDLAHDPAYRLRVTGAVERELALSLAELRALPQVSARLPITCVEGWSAEAAWSGVRLCDLLDRAGAGPGVSVRVVSMQHSGQYRVSYVDPPHVRDPLTLLALRVAGEPLAVDHGFPCRLIAPNRPGVLQTKWVESVEVMG